MDSKLAVRQLKEIEKTIIEFGEEPRLAAEGWGEDWQVLVAIILSAQTRDTKTVVVCEDLFRKYGSVEELAGASLKKIEKVIGSINYYKTKARHIKAACEIIVRDGFIIPPENRKLKIENREVYVKSLMRLPGVGRKTANVYLVAVHRVDAIGVDTHVSRIAFKLGWTRSRNPIVVERDLMGLFPRRYWGSVNWILVRFGQGVGRSRVREDLVLAKLIK